MKKNALFLLVALLPYFPLFCQNIPTLNIKGDTATAIAMTHLNIRVLVTGNIATTTTEIHFYNPFDRELEGELNFPLQEGNTVSRFAMDFNGQWREGVVVEKQQGRQVFENIVRQKVDPALLEMTEGNNFRARVYPIPAKGTKKILIAYEEELKIEDLAFRYALPLNYGISIPHFSFNMRIRKQGLAPVFLENSLPGLDVVADGEDYVIQYIAKDLLFNSQLQCRIPIAEQVTQVFYESRDKENYFYVHLNLPPLSGSKNLPEKLGVYWDVSSSAANRDLARELKFLEQYLKQFQQVKLQLVLFSMAIHEEMSFDIKNGDYSALLSRIENQKLDGGTSLSCLDFSAVEADEILLFTDGLSNFGADEIKAHATPVYAINSSPTGNHNALRFLTKQSGGQYLNLNHLSDQQAQQRLVKQALQFIKATYPGKKTGEVFPSMPEAVQRQFAIAGKLTNRRSYIKLHFGYGQQVVFSQKIPLKFPKTGNSPGIARRWAVKQIGELSLQAEKNKEAITHLGKQFSVVTATTSLIVLDRVEDYVRFKIKPPAEFEKAYEALMKEAADRLAESSEFEEDQMELITDGFETLSDWWETEFAPLPMEGLKKKEAPDSNSSTIEEGTDVVPMIDTVETAIPTTEPVIVDTVVARANPTPIDTLRDELPIVESSPLSGETRTVSGIVTDERGEPLIGASVLVMGTTNGTVTDLDGRYEITVPAGAENIHISYTGFTNQQIAVGEQSKIDISLGEGNQLAEVVVVGYASTRSREVTSAISVVKAEEISGISSALQGRASGVEIIIEDDDSREVLVNKQAIDLLDTLNAPIIIIDGFISTIDDFNSMNAHEIQASQLLEGASALSLYGVAAESGVLLITTRDGDFEPESAQPSPKDSLDKQAPYLDSLRLAATSDYYPTYLHLKTIFPNQPTFFLDIAQFLFERKQTENALRVLSNLAELELENPELIRILGHLLLQNDQPKLAIYCFEKVLDWRPDEPQSYRDLGLAYEKNGEVKRAFDLLSQALYAKWITADYQITNDFEDRFLGIEGLLLMELNALYHRYPKILKSIDVDTALIKPMPTDLRVVLNWSSDMTDIDLWIKEPGGDTCYYNNVETPIGGFLYEDITEGLGPEQYCLKKAVPGDYEILVDFYGDDRPRMIEGLMVQVYVYKYYGTPKQEEYSYSVLLKGESDVAKITKVSFP